MEQAAVVLGASGGIGAALAAALERQAKFAIVHRASRSADTLDYDRRETIAALADRVAAGPSPTLILVATGLLSEEECQPERSLRELEPAWLARQYAINAIGPALAIAELAPLMPRDRTARFGILSAKVGSISDNRLGGWYGYRASKAALNQIVRTASVELARTHPRAVLAALHPGTVRTELSAPFVQRRDPANLFTPDQSAEKMLAVLHGLTPQDSGRLWNWDSSEIAP